MSRRTREKQAPRDRSRSAETGDGDGDDFASEHAKATFVDEVRDGPEHSKDPDSPAGLAGADPQQA